MGSDDRSPGWDEPDAGGIDNLATSDGAERAEPPRGDYEYLLDKLAAFSQAVGTARDLQTIFHALRDFAIVSVPCIGIFISLYDPAHDHRLALYGWADAIDLAVSNLPPMPIT